MKSIVQLTNSFLKKAQEDIPYWYETPVYKEKVKEVVDHAFAQLLEQIPVTSQLTYETTQRGKDVTIKVTAMPRELTQEDLAQAAQLGLDSVFPNVFRVVVTA